MAISKSSKPCIPPIGIRKPGCAEMFIISSRVVVSSFSYEFVLDNHSGQLEKKLNRLFKDNPGINISIMAKQLGMSPRNMARKFFDKLQISPGKWIQTKRIDMAKTLLEESKLSISEICYHIGFDDPSSFSRFSKVTGMGPIPHWQFGIYACQHSFFVCRKCKYVFPTVRPSGSMK